MKRYSRSRREGLSRYMSPRMEKSIDTGRPSGVHGNKIWAEERTKIERIGRVGMHDRTG
jgi:hypothetical protein